MVEDKASSIQLRVSWTVFFFLLPCQAWMHLAGRLCCRRVLRYGMCFFARRGSDSPGSLSTWKALTRCWVIVFVRLRLQVQRLRLGGRTARVEVLLHCSGEDGSMPNTRCRITTYRSVWAGPPAIPIESLKSSPASPRRGDRSKNKSRCSKGSSSAAEHLWPAWTPGTSRAGGPTFPRNGGVQ
ncbi:hypothetical protein B0T24DRAFT_356293 [Lasiosphaeria ovina]|uniref:Uncharacterized protein n=1 Tax=Lasiosphaeria ovina TaxID=92902 RepID=A0AAE0N3V4_9PEZI|nr:hypothetical protein B0T24DRAFT_356293 [Lasiosphaeria ovina]